MSAGHLVFQRPSIRALSASELDAEDVLVAHEKRDCRDWSNRLRSSAIDLDRETASLTHLEQRWLAMLA